MRRILILVEDYNEQSLLESTLKRMGFDVESIRTEASLGEKMMALRPELVIATGDGKKISGLRVSKKVKTKGISGKLILLYPKVQLDRGIIGDNDIADAALETPVNLKSLLLLMSEILELDSKVILNKFSRLTIAKEFDNKPPGMQIITGKNKAAINAAIARGSKPEPEKDKKRIKNYDRFLKDVPESKQAMMPRDTVQAEVRRIRKEENTPEIKKLDEERKIFVEQMFKKG